MANKVNISISKELAKDIEKKIKETNFKSISDYITYILKQVLSSKETETNKKKEEIYSKEEEEEMKQSLRDMGYM